MEPHGRGGEDLTEDALTCEAFPACPETVDEGIFVVASRSGRSASGELEIAKRLIFRELPELDGNTVFGIVLSDMGVIRFPDSDEPALATPETLEAAGKFPASVRVGSGSCPHLAILQALEWANTCAAERNVITFPGAGGSACLGDRAVLVAQAPDEIDDANVKDTRIDAVDIASLRNPGASFLVELARRIGGRSWIVPR